jgi:hypothetical protein
MGNPDEPAKTQSALTPWHVLATGVVVVGLVVLVWVVLAQTGSAQEATTVLAVIVPAFASIGAAVFGVQVAYSRGKETGEKEGDAAGQKRGRQQGKRELAAEALQRLPADAPVDAQGLRAKGPSGGEPPAAAASLGELREALLAVLSEPEE